MFTQQNEASNRQYSSLANSGSIGPAASGNMCRSASSTIWRPLWNNTNGQDYSDGVLLCLAMGGVAANIPTEDVDFLSYPKIFTHILLLLMDSLRPKTAGCYAGGVAVTGKLRKLLH